MTECFICGNDHQQVLQEHHLIPRRLGGSDTDKNLVTLCANCHNCIETLYDDNFFERLFKVFSQYRRLPLNTSPGRPPTGLEYDEFGKFVPASDRYFDIMEAISLKKKKVPLKQIVQMTELPKSTIKDAYERRSIYEEAWHRIEGSDVEQFKSSGQKDES